MAEPNKARLNSDCQKNAQNLNYPHLDMVLDDLISSFSTKNVVLSMARLSSQNHAIAPEMGWDSDAEILIKCWEQLTN